MEQIRERNLPNLHKYYKKEEDILQKSTLRKYLLDKRIELYEIVDELKDKMISNNFTERDTINLEVAESQLNVIKDVITICNNRNKF